MSERSGFLQNTLGMFRDPATPLRDKLLMAGGAVYILSPVDIIPDLIVLLGYTDDFAVLVGTVTLFSRSYRAYKRRH